MTTDAAEGLLMIAVAIAAYLLITLVPWFVAKKRGMVDSGMLFWLSVGFGWSIIGWFIFLLWAALGRTEPVYDPFQRYAERVVAPRSQRIEPRLDAGWQNKSN